ncbi:unnamed protein product [Effrenium voratum]|uniref:Uncharacterized protein n=1 Tax=Effrenium voratum TaxID=2562239 RepID=A0AA36HML5_9DINO|nr:unnamed protein product [Effrenium voratum]
MYRTGERRDEGRWPEPGRTMKKTRERLREDSWQSGAGMRKTRERMRESRRRRPRTRDGAALSPNLQDMSPVPSTAGPADTGNTWLGTARSPKGRKRHPPGASREGELGFQGFVEQQRLLASEMQRQVSELRHQRDEAREQALKVKEDAINDRAKHLQELQQCLLDQLQATGEAKLQEAGQQKSTRLEASSRPEMKAAQKLREVPDPDPQDVWEHSMVSDSRLVAMDAALTALFRRAEDLASRSGANQVSQPIVSPGLSSHRAKPSLEHSALPVETSRTPVWVPPATWQDQSPQTRASEPGSTLGGAQGASPLRLTEQLDKEKVAAFRKALDTADGLPADLRLDLCALLEESSPSEGATQALASKGRPSCPPPAPGKPGTDASPFGAPRPQRPRPRALRAQSSVPAVPERNRLAGEARSERATL